MKSVLMGKKKTDLCALNRSPGEEKNDLRCNQIFHSLAHLTTDKGLTPTLCLQEPQ